MPTSHLKSRDMPKAYHSSCVNGLPGADLLRLRRWWFLNVNYRGVDRNRRSCATTELNGGWGCRGTP